MAELLLELLSEEIPARMQARASDDLKRLVCDGLKAAGLSFTGARAFATPRRLALVVDGIPAARADVSEERRGPRVGAPDQAVQGFLKGAGLASLDQAEKRDTGKGEFWFAVLSKKGGPTADALPGIIEAAMKALPWPKSMRWGSGTETWVRPLQSIIALFDGKVLPGPRFGDSTVGHRFLSKGRITVASFADYVAKLRAAHVILDPAERKAIILDGAQKLCAEAQVTLRADEGLLDEVAGLVEWPVPLIGTIDGQFMDVPAEVLIVSMKNHLRHFVTTQKDGSLASRFVVVANTVARDGGKVITAGNERVLRARLSDAKFFWDQDRKTTLQDRLPALESIVFHAKLGSVAKRVQRIQAFAIGLIGQVIANRFAPTQAANMIEEIGTAAQLCKADLVTGMVGEFPELQGIMGGYYASHDGLSGSVCKAIRDHYAPQGSQDRCPTEPVTIAVALADKFELLVSFWNIGEKPTGSRDPFGLRRAGLGIIRILLENNIQLSLREVLQSFGLSKSESLQKELLEFLVDRLKVQLRDQNVRHDLIDAVFGLEGADNMVLLVARVRALQEFLGGNEGKNLLTAYSRAANIVRAEERKDKGLAARIAALPDAKLFELPEESAVAQSLTQVQHSMQIAVGRSDYVSAMMFFADLRAPLDAFFDKVTVNVTDKPELRLNRLKLLNQIRATMDSVADFSKIEG